MDFIQFAITLLAMLALIMLNVFYEDIVRRNLPPPKKNKFLHRPLRKGLSFGLALILVFAGAPELAFAQSSGTSQVYTPTFTGSGNIATSTGKVTFPVNYAGTVLIRLAGTYTGLTAQVECTESRATNATYTAKGVQTVGGPLIGTLTANGLYKVDASGCSNLEVLASALSTGTVNVTWAISGPAALITVGYPERATYSAVVIGAVPTASATDVFTLAGSASKTIRINRICVSGRATGAASQDVNLVLRSALDTGGSAGTVPTIVPNDSNDPVATAVASYYTGNPTLGAAIGPIGVKQVFYGNLTTGQPGPTACWDWGTHWYEQGPVLRGAAQQLGINFNGQSASDNLTDIEVQWTEE